MDYPEIVALWKASEGVGLGASDEPSAIAQFLDRNPGLSKVAIVDGRIAGAVLAGHDGRRGYLHHLAVAAEFRGRGIGRRLVDACCEELGSLGLVKCNVFVYEANEEGRAFWEHLGWARRDDLRLTQIELAPSSDS